MVFVIIIMIQTQIRIIVAFCSFHIVTTNGERATVI